MKIRSQQGAILFLTLSMGVVISLFVLSLMQCVLLYFKASSRFKTNHEELYQLEMFALKLGETIKIKPACTVVNYTPNEIVTLLAHGNGCIHKVNNVTYTYLIEDMGTYPCIKIKSGKKTYTSTHRLITIKTAKNSNLQLRIATIGSTSFCNNIEGIMLIDPGILSWRYLT